LLDLNSIQYPLLLDGGLSNQLEDQGHDLNDQMWSAKLLLKNPRAITEAHLQYLRAGAEILITSSYQASIQGFIEAFLISREDAISLMENTVKLARFAIDIYQEEVGEQSPKFVAASIGPYGAYLADGSEYTGKYAATDDEIFQFHKDRLDVLVETDADFFACETIPSFREARILRELLKDYETPAWISFSCQNDMHLHDGSEVAVCAELFNGHPTVFALGINCTPPQYISNLIQLIKKIAPAKKVVVYPNSGEVYDAESKNWSGMNDPQICAMMSNEWLNLGADIVGGCCRIGPRHIASIKAVMESR